MRGMVILPGITQYHAAHGRGISQRNGYSAGNYQFMDNESTGVMIIPPGVISS
jgi:hypothetical protein